MGHGGLRKVLKLIYFPIVKQSGYLPNHLNNPPSTNRCHICNDNLLSNHLFQNSPLGKHSTQHLQAQSISEIHYGLIPSRKIINYLSQVSVHSFYNLRLMEQLSKFLPKYKLHFMWLYLSCEQLCRLTLGT